MSRKAAFLVAFTTVLTISVQGVFAGSLTCEQGQEAMCEEYCTHTGGGMSGNPDGSVTCTYLMKVQQGAKYDQKTANDNDWIMVMIHKRS